MKYKIAVVGLGYVGLPLARLFSTRYETLGYDIDQSRVDSLMQGKDKTSEVDGALLQEALSRGFKCSSRLADIQDANIYIITVPTPVDLKNHPDLTPLKNASAQIGEIISKGDIVIYESTVYPGVTEGVCIPIIENVSGLVFNEDFFAGYSPERINPGDKEHSIERIKKVTSGSTPEIAKVIDDLYNSVLVNGTHLAPSIRVAEASKIVENCQRDVNIAFFNELAKIFNVLHIDTHDVIEAAATKWNFIKMTPGLVGGHCISVDPYYLIEKSQVQGYSPNILIEARSVNDGMGEYIAGYVIKLMNKKGILLKNAKVLILGFTFKENCPDIRNTKVIDIHRVLSEYTNQIQIVDPHAGYGEVKTEYGVEVKTDIEGNDFDLIILAVAHDEFKNIQVSNLAAPNSVVFDVKGILDRKDISGRL